MTSKKSSPYHCIVCTLTKLPLVTLGKETQQKIVKAGRPENDNMPNLFAICHKTINLDVYSWVTGCDKNQKLYCWPCLLFSNSQYDTWGKRGFSDFNWLSMAVVEHTKDVSHQAKMKTLNLWIETYSDGSDDSSDDELQSSPEINLLKSNDSEVEELDIKPNLEALNASSSSSSQHAVKAILDLCDPAEVKEIEIPGSSPIVIRDNSPEPESISSKSPTTEITAEPAFAESQDYEKANIYRTFMHAISPFFSYSTILRHSYYRLCFTGDTDSQATGSGAEKYQLKWHSHQQNLNSSISYLYKYTDG